LQKLFCLVIIDLVLTGCGAVWYPQEWENVYKEWQDKKITATTAMERLNIKRTTFYKLAGQYNK